MIKWKYDIVGSFLRPQEIKEARQQYAEGKIQLEQLRKIAEYKLPDLNCTDVEAAMKVVAGTARNMGISIDE